MRARKVEIKLRRNDTEPDPDEQHRYGPRIDGLLDELAGGAGRIDRTVRPFPNARAVSTRARLELHEDGPILQTALEHLPELLNAAASLLTAWVAWKSARKNLSKDERRWEQRTVEITVGPHSYAGRPTVKEAKKIARLLASL